MFLNFMLSKHLEILNRFKQIALQKTFFNYTDKFQNHKKNSLRSRGTHQHPKSSVSPSAVVSAKIAKLLSHLQGFFPHGT